MRSLGILTSVCGAADDREVGDQFDTVRFELKIGQLKRTQLRGRKLFLSRNSITVIVANSIR